MKPDPILEPLYRMREEHAAKFNYDLHAICADYRKQQEADIAAGKRCVTLAPNRIEPSKPPAAA